MFPNPGKRNADAVIFARGGGEVEDYDDLLFWAIPFADEADDGISLVVGFNPFETFVVELFFMECGFGFVKDVERLNRFLDAFVGMLFGEVPIEALVVVPFFSLAEFTPLKYQFCTRVGELFAEKEAEIGELLPVVAGHFVQQRIFAVHDFVMGEGEAEILGEGINEREGEFV